MNREVHVRFCEGVGVKFPRATRPLIHTIGSKDPSTECGTCSEVAECGVCYVQFPTGSRGLHCLILISDCHCYLLSFSVLFVTQSFSTLSIQISL